VGFVGAMVLVALYLALVLRGLVIAARARDRFGVLLVLGLTSTVFWQAVINIGMTTACSRRRHPAAVLQLRRIVAALPAPRHRTHDERLDAEVLLLAGRAKHARAQFSSRTLLCRFRVSQAVTTLPIAFTSCDFGTAPMICSFT
jgi:hypothetical protein